MKNGIYNSFSVSGVNALPRFGSLNPSEIKMTEVEYKHRTEASLYIHIPFCKTICPFCMLRKGAKLSEFVSPELFDGILKELELIKVNFKLEVLDSVYIGGGTPSLLSIQQIERLIIKINSLFKLTPSFEITFEGEAQSLNDISKLEALNNLGVNRISYGVQTFNQKLRKLLGRTDTLNDLYQLRDLLDKVGFKDINIDYMYNLPGTSIKDIEVDFVKIEDYSPTSIDCHPLKYISCSKKLLGDFVRQNLIVPPASERIKMFEFIRERTSELGFIEQFTDQYSKFKLNKNNNLYMQHLYGLKGGEYIGVGAGARSHFGDFGFTNTQNFHDYLNKINKGEFPTLKKVYAPHVDNYISLFPKRNDKIRIADIEKSLHHEYFKEKFKALEKSKMVVYQDNGWILSKQGVSWYQNLQEELLSPDQRDRHIHSAKERSKKLHQFDNFFDSVGEILD